MSPQYLPAKFSNQISGRWTRATQQPYKSPEEIAVEQNERKALRRRVLAAQGGGQDFYQKLALTLTGQGEAVPANVMQGATGEPAEAEKPKPLYGGYGDRPDAAEVERRLDERRQAEMRRMRGAEAMGEKTYMTPASDVRLGPAPAMSQRDPSMTAEEEERRYPRAAEDRRRREHYGTQLATEKEARLGQGRYEGMGEYGELQARRQSELEKETKRRAYPGVSPEVAAMPAYQQTMAIENWQPPSLPIQGQQYINQYLRPQRPAPETAPAQPKPQPPTPPVQPVAQPAPQPATQPAVQSAPQPPVQQPVPPAAPALEPEGARPRSLFGTASAPGTIPGFGQMQANEEARVAERAHMDRLRGFLSRQDSQPAPALPMTAPQPAGGQAVDTATDPTYQLMQRESAENARTRKLAGQEGRPGAGPAAVPSLGQNTREQATLKTEWMKRQLGAMDATQGSAGPIQEALSRLGIGEDVASIARLTVSPDNHAIGDAADSVRFAYSQMPQEDAAAARAYYSAPGNPLVARLLEAMPSVMRMAAPYGGEAMAQAKARVEDLRRLVGALTGRE